MATPAKKKPQITKDQIVQEALALLDETSLSGLTMRVLADRLGIRAASLYWHFPNKAALESAMSELLFLRALDSVPDTGDWREWTRGLGRAVWDNLINRPDSGLLIMTADLTEEQFQRTSAAVRGRLARFDVDQDSAFRLHSGIQALIIGWVTVAHSPYIHRLENLIDTRKAAMETLDAMIDGWSARMEN